MAGVKRKLEVFQLSEVACTECTNTIVHGIVTELSPVKRSKKDQNRKYFSDTLCLTAKVVSKLYQFEPSLRSAMDDSMCKNLAISIVDVKFAVNLEWIRRF